MQLFTMLKSQRADVQRAIDVQESHAEATDTNLPKSHDRLVAALERDDAGGQSEKALNKAWNTACNVLELHA